MHLNLLVMQKVHLTFLGLGFNLMVGVTLNLISLVQMGVGTFYGALIILLYRLNVILLFLVYRLSSIEIGCVIFGTA